jgi:hypothetical protein
VNTKTLILVVVVVVLVVGAGLYFFTQPKNLKPLADAASETPKEVTPSKTFIDYSDPAGFSFSYPDNVSISNRASEIDTVIDPDAYADLQLFSKDKSGSLNLRIADSKFKTIQDWIKDQGLPENTTPVEKKLGELTAYEVRTSDRLMLGALDQGILFTVDMPLIEEPFWMEVYNKVTGEFAFAAPEAATTQTSAAVSPGDEVIFEGEEVVE